MRKFPWGRTFLIGFGFLGISVLWPIFNQWIPIILQINNPVYIADLVRAGKTIPNLQGFALGPGMAMFIMTWDNIINMFVQPWIGARSDRTWNRFGRRKSWILIGLPIALLGFISIPFAKGVIAIAVFVLITNFGMALFRSPVIAWLGDLFNVQERSRANGVINMMGGIGGVLAFVGGGYVFKLFGKPAPFIAGAVALAISMIVVLLLVKEPKEIVKDPGADESIKGLFTNLKEVASNQDKSMVYLLLAILFWFTGFGAVETGLSSFAIFSLHIPAATASVVAATANLSFMAFAIPSGIIAGRLGRRKTILWGLVGLVPVFILGYFFISNILTLIIGLVLVGFFWAWVNVNSLPLVYDHGDEKRIGAFTGLYYFSSQLAAVIGPVCGGQLVEKLGFDYRILFLFGSIFMVLAFLAMLKVKDVAHESKKRAEMTSLA
jgi:maltose/moltooligosaccharide transporter